MQQRLTICQRYWGKNSSLGYQIGLGDPELSSDSRITGFCNGASLWSLKHCATDNSKDGSNVLWPPNNSVSLETEILNLSIHPHNSAGVLKPTQDWYPVVFNDT